MDTTLLSLLRSLGAVPLQWSEADDDGESYACVYHGQVIRGSTPALVLAGVQDLLGHALVLVAA